MLDKRHDNTLTPRQQGLHMVPGDWTYMEQLLHEALDSGLVLVGDNRDACKLWFIDGYEVFAYMVGEFQQDESRTLSTDLSPDDVCQFSFATEPVAPPIFSRIN